jgi:hypothetical protein
MYFIWNLSLITFLELLLVMFFPICYPTFLKIMLLDITLFNGPMNYWQCDLRRDGRYCKVNLVPYLKECSPCIYFDLIWFLFGNFIVFKMLINGFLEKNSNHYDPKKMSVKFLGKFNQSPFLKKNITCHHIYAMNVYWKIL